MIRKITVEIITSLLILLFIYAGVSKLIDYHLFKFQLGKSPLIGAWAPQIAVLLPIGELVLALMLIIEPTRKFGLYVSSALMLLFTLYIGYMLTFSTHLPCTCGGLISSLNWRNHLVFNIFFSLISIMGVLLYRKQEQTAQTHFNNYHLR